MVDAINFSLNGKDISISVRPDNTVLDVIRNHLRLTGTKEGCAEGDCGACSILVARPEINEGIAKAANACIMTAGQIDGAAITTVEGLSNDGVLSALQREMAANGSSQCGFCTPGIAIALAGLLQGNDEPKEDDIHDALAGNLCRCTGYRPIVEAAQKASQKTREYRQVSPKISAQETIEIDGASCHRPTTLSALLKLRADLPEATLLAGGTDLGVARAAYEDDWSDIILTSHVDALRVMHDDDKSWTFGAAVTWAEMLPLIAQKLPSFATLIRRFGSAQIRSMGTIGGNIGTASPIGDGPPALIALGARVNLAALDGTMTSMSLEDFFLDYRKTALPKGGVIVSIELPKPSSSEVFRTYKISKRFDQDISTVCGAFWLEMDGDIITDIRLTYGGMAAIPKRARNAENKLLGQTLTLSNIEAAADCISEDLTPLSDWRGSASYRARVAKGLLSRLYHDVHGETVEVMAL